MTYVNKMISMEQSDAAWLAQNNVSLSLFVRNAIFISKDSGATDLRSLVEKLRLVNLKLNDLLAAYQLDESVKKEDFKR